MGSRRTSRWTIGFDAWGGVPVRLHLLMVLFAVATVSVTLGTDLQNLGLLMVVTVVVSVAAHEAAHCFAALRLGGVVDEVILTPIGGLRAPRVPDEPEPQVFVALVGPMTNLALVMLATGGLIYLQEPQIMPLFNPVSPAFLTVGSTPVVALKLALWINATLFLLNLIPAYPFDGGPALRAMLWPLLGRRSAGVVAAQLARAVAAGLVLVAVATHKTEPTAIVPLWAPLVTLAVFILFSAQQDLALASSLEASRDGWRPDDSGERSASEQLDWSSSEDQMVLVQPRGEARNGRQEAQQLADDAYEDARVDDILARLHNDGLDKLTAEERRVLERASLRYRYRRQPDADDSNATDS